MTPTVSDAVRVHESLGLDEALRRLEGTRSRSSGDPLADDIRNRLMNDTTTPRNTRDERQG